MFERLQSSLPAKEDSSDNPMIRCAHLKKSTLSMLGFFEQHRGSLSFRNSVSHSPSPYEVADRVWRIVNPNEVCCVFYIFIPHCSAHPSFFL